VGERAGDSGCPKDAEEGNAVGTRHISVGTGRRHGTPLHADRDASFTRSFDPYSSILTMHRRGNSAVVGRLRRHRGQANRVTGGTGTGVGEADGVLLAACHCPAMGGVVRKEKEGDRGLRPCEETRSELVWLPVRR